MPNAIGLIEVTSIAMGYELQDAMLKTADVELLTARTICSGKYLVIVTSGSPHYNGLLDKHRQQRRRH